MTIGTGDGRTIDGTGLGTLGMVRGARGDLGALDGDQVGLGILGGDLVGVRAGVQVGDPDGVLVGALDGEYL